MKNYRILKLSTVLFLVTLFSVLLTSCYPDYGLTTQDYDIVATFKDDAVNFDNYQTFFLGDSIHEIKDGGIIEGSNEEYDQQVLNTIANEMEVYGYTRVNSTDAADVVLYVGRSSSTSFSYYPGYWWGYYGWYYPWYGGYGGYSYAYTTGSLFITMMDPDKFNQAQKIVGAVWSGSANGVLDNSTSVNIKDRAIKSVMTMFEQSPYLNTAD